MWKPKPRQVTRERFEADYARESGVTVAQLRAYGRYVMRCDCGNELCVGWQMGHR